MLKISIHNLSHLFLCVVVVVVSAHIVLHLRAVREHLMRWAIIGRIIYLFIIWSTILSLIAGYHHHNSHNSILINLLFSHLYVSILPRNININFQPWLFWPSLFSWFSHIYFYVYLFSTRYIYYMRARLCLYDPFSTKASIKINIRAFDFG